ncbi:KR domain-containing protein, partial [Streptomyces himastatinicus]
MLAGPRGRPPPPPHQPVPASTRRALTSSAKNSSLWVPRSPSPRATSRTAPRCNTSSTTSPPNTPLTTVIHTAGTMDLGPITELDPERLQYVLHSKALAATHLHEITRDLGLDAFVLFSSNAATWGSGQQAAYAAANAHLDALAEHRRAHGLPATSIAWGPWSEAGMAADENTLAHLRRRGLSPLTTDLAIKSLHHALTHDDTTVTVADVDWERFSSAFTA